MQFKSAFLGALAVAAAFACAPTALLAQGFDNDAIAEARRHRPGAVPYGYHYWGGPGVSPYAYDGRCPRQLVPVRLRDGRVVNRWVQAC